MKRAAILVALAIPALTQTAVAAPCECKDIPSFKQRIAEVTKYLEAFRHVLADCYSNNPPWSFQQEIERFNLYAFGGERPANIQDAGTVDPFGTKASDEFKKMYCDTIVKAVDDVHEGDHQVFMWLHALPITVGAAIGSMHGDTDTTFIRNIALTEVEAHEAEKEFLEQELQKLEERCKQNWKCHCNQQMYPSAGACAASCPHASPNCVAPTCLEIDPKTGKWTGKGY
ncbi:MAG: hypothetical protein ABSG25_02140 [Bryobacteraceae bacterium]